MLLAEEGFVAACDQCGEECLPMRFTGGQEAQMLFVFEEDALADVVARGWQRIPTVERTDAFPHHSYPVLCPKCREASPEVRT